MDPKNEASNCTSLAPRIFNRKVEWPKARRARLERIRQLVETGQYRPDLREVAAQLLKDLGR